MKFNLDPKAIHPQQGGFAKEMTTREYAYIQFAAAHIASCTQGAPAEMVADVAHEHAMAMIKRMEQE